MKTLYLARHAKSSWKFPDLTDHDRPLNKRGTRDKARMADFLLEQAGDIQVIYSSTAVRALDYAVQVEASLAVPLRSLPQLYTFEADRLLQVIQTLDDDCASSMVIAHNPGVTDLLNRLTGESILNVPTAAVAKVRFQLDCWNQISERMGDLLALWTPKQLI